MAFTLTLKTGNEAFADKNQEIARILRATADKVEKGQDSGIVVDANGNRVGTFETED